MNLTTTRDMDNLISSTGILPAAPSEEKVYLSDEDCFLRLFDSSTHLCFDRQLKDVLDRFGRKYSKRQVRSYKLLRFTINSGEQHFLSRMIIDLAKSVYNDKVLRELATKLDLSDEKEAYDIYTDYFEKLRQKNPILIVISNFYEEVSGVTDAELGLFCKMMETCDNVRVWICGEDKMDEQRHSAYFDFYQQFDPIPQSFYEALQSGEPLPYVYFSYNWEPKSNNTVDQLCDIVKMRRIPHQRDKENCGYRSDIHEFMNRIRRGYHVVILFSKPYLKSFYCMYEFAGLLEHPDYEKRIHPIIVDPTIREDSFEKELEDYWKAKRNDRPYKDSLKDKTVNYFTLKRKTEMMNDYINKVPVIVDYLARIDGNTLEDMKEQNYETLLNDLSNQIKVRI